MSKNEKLLAKLLNEQMTFTWPELVTLLRRLGYTQIEGAGSRVKFHAEDRDGDRHQHHATGAHDPAHHCLETEHQDAPQHDVQQVSVILGKVLRIGLPTGLQMVVLSLSELVILALVNSHGSQATAA